jgi:hypothetical protein
MSFCFSLLIRGPERLPEAVELLVVFAGACFVTAGSFETAADGCGD